MIKTINLPAATETIVAVDKKYAFIKNIGNNAIYASKSDTVVPDADDVQCILPGTAELIKDINLASVDITENTNVSANLYFLCSETNKIEIQTSDDANFKSTLKGGDLEEFALNKLTLDDLKSATSGGTWNNNVYTNNGIAYTVNLLASGKVKSITVNGTATANSTFIFKRVDSNKLTLNKNYWMQGAPTGSTSTHFLRLALQETMETWKENQNDTGTGVGFTANYEYYSIYIRVVSGVTVNNAIYRPVLFKDY